MYYAYYESPIGLVEIGGTEAAITSLYFVDLPCPDYATHATVQAAVEQLAEYFAGTRKTFDLPLDFYGTTFQQQVWRQLLHVPYGVTASYQEIALALGNAKATRAVGAANGANPISIIAPCHRIVGSNGKLTGYGGGLWRKEWLLKHEGCLLLTSMD